jgi:two-component system cell cycle response regulator
MAFGDPLTKLANRRYFDQTLERELSRARRSGLGLSLAMLDIDHFKLVNDTWGHPVGDRVLVAVARSLLHSVRSYDFVARIGGEEFTILLPGTSLADGKHIVERICADLRTGAPVVIGAQSILVTCSAGVSGLSPSIKTADELVASADRALYAAKTAGRNRVVAFDENFCGGQHATVAA